MDRSYLTDPSKVATRLIGRPTNRVIAKHKCLIPTVGNLKGIPYETEDRGDGNPNVGFMPLKGKQKDSRRVPEASNEPGLLDALKRLNDPRSAFFTSGCEKCYNVRGGLERPIGYVEFVHNSMVMARDEDTYWTLLEGLDNHMVETGYALPVHFEYIVTPTQFNAHGFRGFSVAVYVRLTSYMSYKIARNRWRQGLGFLTSFLCSIPPGDPPLFYG